MSSASARLSKSKVDREYLTHASLVSMYNSIILVGGYYERRNN